MQQEKDETIRDYFSRMEKLVNEMKNNGDKITEKDVIEKIMRTLTSRFDYVVTAIEESRDLNSMTLNDLQASLESREMWMNERSPSKPNEALKAATNRAQQNQRCLNFRSKGGKSFEPTARRGERGNESFKDKSHI